MIALSNRAPGSGGGLTPQQSQSVSDMAASVEETKKILSDLKYALFCVGETRFVAGTLDHCWSVAEVPYTPHGPFSVLLTFCPNRPVVVYTINTCSSSSS